MKVAVCYQNIGYQLSNLASVYESFIMSQVLMLHITSVVFCCPLSQWLRFWLCYHLTPCHTTFDSHRNVMLHHTFPFLMVSPRTNLSVAYNIPIPVRQ